MIHSITEKLIGIPRSALVALAILMLSGLAITVVFAMRGSLVWSTAAIATLFAVTLVAPGAIALARRTFDPLEPIYLWIALYGYLYLAKPIARLMADIPFIYGGASLDRALLLALLGLVLFYAGYRSGIGSWVAAHIPPISQTTSPRRLAWAAWTFIFIGFVGLHLFIEHSGGWTAFWSQPHGHGGQAATSTAYLYQLPELMVIGFLLLFQLFVMKPARHVRDWLLLMVGGLGGVGIITILMGSRTFFSWILIAGAVIYYLARQRRPTLRQTLAFFLLLFIVVTAVPFYRGYVHLGGDISRMFDLRQYKILQGSLLNGNEFDVYLAEVTLVPAVIPYGYFYFQRNLVFHPIPRLIWPDKPTTLNKYWDEFLIRSSIQAGSAETFLGDLYAQLGVIGIIIGAFLAGAFWRAAYAYLVRFPGNRSVHFVYAMLLPNLFIFLAQSSAIAFLKWLPYILPASILAFIIARKRDEVSDSK